MPRPLRKDFCTSCLIVSCVFGITSPARVTAQCEVQKLWASDADRLDEFGIAVAVQGGVAVVGAHKNECVGGVTCGAAYVYRWTGSAWTQEQKLGASDAPSGAGAGFGVSVATSGDVALAGAWLDDCAAGFECGAAYLYRFDGSSWLEEEKLTAEDATGVDWYGFSVSVDGDFAAVGAPAHHCGGGTAFSGCGAAYLYQFNNSRWVYRQRLTAQLEPALRFGTSIALGGNVLVIGAPGQDCAVGDDCGAAYVYRFNKGTWTLEQELRAFDAASADRFGYSVSASNDAIIIGADLRDCSGGADCGAAYIYRYKDSAWGEEQQLGASSVAGDRFGVAVSVSGDAALVGVVRDDCNIPGSCGGGYVYRFDGSAWVEKELLMVGDALELDLKGAFVSVSGDVAILGAAWDDCGPDNVNCGSASIFALGPDCNANDQADLCDIRDGDSDDADGDGSPDECEGIAAWLDIKPGTCPNRVNPKARGVVTAVLGGDEAFDITQVDMGTLLLRRADGVGESVAPKLGPPGPGVHIGDRASAGSEACACDGSGPDGIDDLVLRFDVAEVAERLELGTLPAGSSVMLMLTGSLLDGTSFEATDCILIPGTSVRPLDVYPVSSSPAHVRQIP